MNYFIVKTKTFYMNTLTLEIMVPQPQKFEIPIPFFARTKDDTEYIGLLDEKTLVSIFKCGDLTIIKNKSTDAMFANDELVHAFQKWHSCTETEFLDKYDAVIDSISLHPKLAV